jgi:hypothetical protein
MRTDGGGGMSNWEDANSRPDQAARPITTSAILRVAGNVAPALIQAGFKDPATIAEKAYEIAEAIALVVQARWKG